VTAGPEVAVYLMTTGTAELLVRPARESRREHPASWTALVEALGEQRVLLADVPREWNATGNRPRLG
jgi:RNase adaptor protein for sRNA GlmZ degradation